MKKKVSCSWRILLAQVDVVLFLDSGCSNHMAGTKSMFKEIDESNKSEVCLGDEKTLRVEGKGTIAIKTEEEGGYKVVFDEAACAISDKTTRQVLSLIHMDGNMVFPLDVLTVQGKDLVAQIKGDATTNLCHLCQGN